jgi:hypothetical protein
MYNGPWLYQIWLIQHECTCIIIDVFELVKSMLFTGGVKPMLISTKTSANEISEDQNRLVHVDMVGLESLLMKLVFI